MWLFSIPKLDLININKNNIGDKFECPVVRKNLGSAKSDSTVSWGTESNFSDNDSDDNYSKLNNSFGNLLPEYKLNVTSTGKFFVYNNVAYKKIW